MVTLREPPLILAKTEEQTAVPKRALRHFILGDQFYRARQFKKALAEYDEALAFRPDNPALLNNRGDTLYCLGRYEDAIDAFRRAISLQPDLVEAHDGRGVALMALNRHQEALQAFEKAIEVQPGYIDALFNRGLTLLRMGLLEDADAAIKEALTLLPDADLSALLNELREEKLRRLRRRGIISWGGGKPTGARPRVRISEGPPLSNYIIASRR